MSNVSSHEHNLIKINQHSHDGIYDSFAVILMSTSMYSSPYVLVILLKNPVVPVTVMILMVYFESE